MKPTRISLALIIVVLPFLLIAQNAEKRFSIGVSFSPDYAYRVLKTDASHEWMLDVNNEYSSPILGYTSGLILKYRLNGKLALESGVKLLAKGEKMVVNKRDLVGIDTDVNYDMAVPDKSKTVYHYQYLGIPVKFNYYFLRTKVQMFISSGISTDFFLSGKTKSVLEFKDRTEKETYDLDYDFNKINFTGLVGIGLETNIAQNLQFRCEPVCRYTFSPLVNAPLKEHLYSLGMNIVLFANF